MTDLDQERWAAQRHALGLANACLTATEALEALYCTADVWRVATRAFNIHMTAKHLHLALSRFPKEVLR